MEYLLQIILPLLGIGIILYFTNKHYESKAKKNNDIITIGLKRYGLNTSQIMFSIESPSCTMLRSNQGRLFVQQPGKSMKEIKLENILDTKVDIHSSYKNQKRVISLVSTYDSTVKVDAVEFKLTTGYATYSAKVDTNGKNASDTIDYMQRLKLIIDKNINELNKNI